MNMKAYVEQLGERAVQAAASLATLSSEIKNNALGILAGLLESRGAEVLAANELDIASGREAGLAAAMIDRLTAGPARVLGESYADLASMEPGLVDAAPDSDPGPRSLDDPSGSIPRSSGRRRRNRNAGRRATIQVTAPRTKKALRQPKLPTKT